MIKMREKRIKWAHLRAWQRDIEIEAIRVPDRDNTIELNEDIVPKHIDSGRHKEVE